MPAQEGLIIYKSILISLSHLIPACIALIRLKKIDPFYLPFLFWIWVSSINEILGIILWNNGIPVSVNNNIYVLAEAVLLILFFKNAGVFRQHQNIFFGLITAIILFWLGENLLAGKINRISSWFRILASTVLVILSVNCFNKLTLGSMGDFPQPYNLRALKKPVFLICVGIIFFFTSRLIVETFWLYGLGASDSFRMGIYSILIYLNLGVNIIYTIAILWMRPKQQYIML